MSRGRYNSTEKNVDKKIKASSASERIDAGAASRYEISQETYNLLIKDYIRIFQAYPNEMTKDGKVAFPYKFINQILTNYLLYMQRQNAEKLENDMLAAIKADIRYDYTENRISINSELSNVLVDFDFVYSKNFKKRAVFNYILNDFAQCDLSTREKILCYPNFLCITEAIDKGYSLKVEISHRILEYKPYKLDIDDNSLSVYLLGYSRVKVDNTRPKETDNINHQTNKADECSDTFNIYPIKLSRIEKCSCTHKEASISFLEEKQIKNAITRYGVSYVHETHNNDELIKVRLSWFGYNIMYLKIINHQRPLPINAPNIVTLGEKKYYDLTFNCSERQIKNYFLKFGQNAIVLEPESLRQEFIEHYRKALDTYEVITL